MGIFNVLKKSKFSSISLSLDLAQLQSLPEINLDNPFKADAWA